MTQLRQRLQEGLRTIAPSVGQSYQSRSDWRPRFYSAGIERNDGPARLPMNHGTILFWAGPARLRYHGNHATQ